jgi:hypothetical protein
MPALDFSTLSDAQINAAIAEAEGFEWVPTGYATDLPPRARWLTLCYKDSGFPEGWRKFPSATFNIEVNRRMYGVPDYATSCDECVRLLESLDRLVSIKYLHESKLWMVAFYNSESTKPIYVEQPTFPRAACLAWGRAKGIFV